MRRILSIIAIIGIAVALLPTAAAADSIAGTPFYNTWARTDLPVANGNVSRTWMWGPQADSPALSEPYAEASGGQREVQYFDKARMEITHPDGDPGSIWYVTNGLLAEELITGRMQLGDNTFHQYAPAQVNVAGDLNDPNGPTYASFTGLMGYGAIPNGWVITQTVNRAGQVGADNSLTSYNVSAMDIGAPTHHTVASVFWSFMNSSGLVSQNGQQVTAPLFQNAFYATGYPLTEAYWTHVLVGGVSKLVLVQVFERRVLTYTPSNPAGWQVESGNVGLQYYQWRYVQLGLTPEPFPNASMTAPTSVRIIEPFAVGGGLAAGLSVQETTSGSCWEGSLADSGRSDAWRCMAGNEIMDPCFSDPSGDGNAVACLTDPWNQQVVLLDLTQPLPFDHANTPAIPEADPWALELADGERCTMTTGATAAIGNLRANYACTGGGWVYGDPDRTTSTWSVLLLPNGGSSLGSVAVAVAWY